MKANRLSTVYPVIALTIVVFIAVAVLAGMDSMTREKIEWQREQKILRMLNEIFPDMSRYVLEEDIYVLYSDETKLGYAFLATGKGYGGYIDILVGLVNETTVKGISIIAHTETPGLGNKITKPDFRDRFIGQNITDVALTADDGKIDAITGATISSKAVINAVRTAAMEKVEALWGENDKETE